MEVLIPIGSGFCPGVLSAEKKLFSIREKHKGLIYLSGMFIHNKEYKKYLEKNKIIEFANSIFDSKQNSYGIKEDKPVFVIATHGIDRKLEEEFKKNFIVYDLTCPKVKNVQKIIYQNRDSIILITGKENHPEVKSLKSYAINYHIISNSEYLIDEKFLCEIKDKEILLISQTTSDSFLFNEVISFLNIKYQQNFIKKLIIQNTICPTIEKRENNSIDIMKKNKLKAIVIGDILSSNSQRLYKKLKEINEDVFFVEQKEDIYKFIDKIKSEKKIMVVSSSSTPSFIENQIVDLLKNI